MTVQEIAKNIVKFIVFLILFGIVMAVVFVDMLVNMFPLAYYLTFGTQGYLLYGIIMVVIPIGLLLVTKFNPIWFLLAFTVAFGYSNYLYYKAMDAHPEYDTRPSTARKSES